MQRGFPEGLAEKARAVLAQQAKDVLNVIDGQYRRGLLGAAERDQKLVAGASALAPEGLRQPKQHTQRQISSQKGE